jgi:hypothetical protein
MMVALYLLLTLAALVLAGWASPARSRVLALALLALAWGVGQCNTLIEAVVFGVMPLRDAEIQAAVTVALFGLLAAIAVALLGKWHEASPEPVRLRFTPARLGAVILAYELLYFGAGTLVWPFIADFYAQRTVPPFGLVAALQVPRALIFVAAAWPWLRTGPRHAPWVLGAAFALIGGIAPLLPDNPYMPADVRLAHGIETGSSNFLFGWILAWLLRPKA